MDPKQAHDRSRLHEAPTPAGPAASPAPLLSGAYLPAADTLRASAVFENLVDILYPGSLEQTFRARIRTLHAAERTLPAADRLDTALAAIQKLDEGACRTIVKKFLDDQRHDIDRHPWLYYGAGIVGCHEPPQHGNQPHFTEVLQSLLSTGLAPAAVVDRGIGMLREDLCDHAHDAKTMITGWAALGTATVSWFVVPAPFSFATSVGAVWLSHKLGGQELIADAAIDGYILENIDAHDTLRSGCVTPLATTLHNRGAVLSTALADTTVVRTHGFLLARALRVFGHPPDDVFGLFRDSPHINRPGNPLVETVREYLADQNIRTSEALSLPQYFRPDVESQRAYAEERQLLEALNQAHFTLGISYRAVTQAQCAHEVLQRS